MNQSKNRKFNILNIVALIAAVSGVVLSAFFIKEDVLSTKMTLMYYFPQKFGVTPASTESGGAMLGWFTSVLQVVSAFTARNNKLSRGTRFWGYAIFFLACAFDNWTDIVFRSGQLTGNLIVAIVTTFAFYTFGSEIAQAFAWILIGSSWREAVSEVMWLSANFSSSIASISGEYKNIKRHVREREQRERGLSFNSPSESWNKDALQGRKQGQTKKNTRGFMGAKPIHPNNTKEHLRGNGNNFSGNQPPIAFYEDEEYFG